jgi:hypothetical protein
MPELARGTVTRLFTLMGKAASDGGAKLDAFAKVAGVSSKQFHDAYGTPEFGAVFLKFMNGLHESGGNANQVLGELGINSVRDRPALLNLANAANSAGEAGALLAQTMRDANKGFKDQSAVADQYAVIAATVAFPTDGTRQQLRRPASMRSVVTAWGRSVTSSMESPALSAT